MLSFLVPIIRAKKIELIHIATYQDFFSNQILNKSLAVKIDNFLKPSKNTINSYI